MVMIVNGSQVLYDEFQAGCAVDETSDSKDILLTFHDKDNDTVHMFRMAPLMMEQYLRLIQQTIAGAKIEITSQMPKGPHKV